MPGACLCGFQGDVEGMLMHSRYTLTRLRAQPARFKTLLVCKFPMWPHTAVPLAGRPTVRLTWIVDQAYLMLPCIASQRQRVCRAPATWPTELNPAGSGWNTGGHLHNASALPKHGKPAGALYSSLPWQLSADAVAVTVLMCGSQLRLSQTLVQPLPQPERSMLGTGIDGAGV